MMHYIITISVETATVSHPFYGRHKVMKFYAQLEIYPTRIFHMLKLHSKVKRHFDVFAATAGMFRFIEALYETLKDEIYCATFSVDGTGSRFF